MPQAVEHLLCKHEALSSNLNPTKNKTELLQECKEVGKPNWPLAYPFLHISLLIYSWAITKCVSLKGLLVRIGL
jgi:hypothetical protein